MIHILGSATSFLLMNVADIAGLDEGPHWAYWAYWAYWQSRPNSGTESSTI